MYSVQAFFIYYLFQVMNSLFNVPCSILAEVGQFDKDPMSPKTASYYNVSFGMIYTTGFSS